MWLVPDRRIERVLSDAPNQEGGTESPNDSALYNAFVVSLTPSTSAAGSSADTLRHTSTA